MLGVELRRARAEDAQAVAAIWTVGWRDGHLGNVPDTRAGVRTPESSPIRATQRVAGTTTARSGREVAALSGAEVAARSGRQVAALSGAEVAARSGRQVAARGHEAIQP